MAEATAENGCMSKTPSRKPSRMVRIREPLAVQGEALAVRLASDLTQVVNEALREKLERNGLWPPPDKPAKKSS